jgi:NAD-dependent dihydropyrimidine dehydrogenase PreA subunit
MVRKIITIDREKCNGCGACVSACHEGAIALVDGKAKLVRDDYCDGLGNCLPACPTESISFEEREAAAFDEVAVKENMAKKQVFQGCPGTNSKTLNRQNTAVEKPAASAAAETHLNQWPVQIKLVPINAPYFNGAHLLVAADCVAYAYGNFHNEFMKNKITIIGCPKLDEGDYSEKLTEILKRNDIKSVTVARIEVPCCGGLENAVKSALMNCGKMIPWQIVTFSTDGRILDN